MTKRSETWDEMTARHKKERIDQIMFFSKTHTQTEASKILEIKLTTLNNFLRRNKLNWKEKYKLKRYPIENYPRKKCLEK